MNGKLREFRHNVEIKNGHFYRVIVVHDLKFVIKIHKNKRERLNCSKDNEIRLFEQYDIRNGLQIFPRKNSSIAKHFLYPVYSSKSKKVIVQPLADTSREKKLQALNELGSLSLPDLHDDNVGYYGDKPVMIDYWHS